MLEIKANIWDFKNDWKCITTNSTIKSDGSIVMGAGIARDARDMYPQLAFDLAKHIKAFGNTPCAFYKYKIITFPTKNNWWEASDIKLIEKSARDIVSLVSGLKIKVLYTVRPGCGLGNLSWKETVKPLIENIFDDRFRVCYV